MKTSFYKPSAAQSALSPFARQWQTNTLAYMLAAKRDGTVSQSVDSLFQCVRIPSHAIEGAPLGTNARYFAKEIFVRDVIGTSPSLRAFATL